jgi:hypothetical protein
MKRDNRSAAVPVFVLEMFSVMLLSALLVGMMMSESMALSTVLLGPKPRLGCSGPCANGCSRSSKLPGSAKPCTPGCLSTASCNKCECKEDTSPPNMQPFPCYCQ